jgi:hypothetical protein
MMSEKIEINRKDERTKSFFIIPPVLYFNETTIDLNKQVGK